ncbi:hypothetical protein [Blastococcus litoris]|uniref:hypothetical protein n=1 Tax=Blastococcus litoris TaxID=2171622 RepID=UPI000E3018AA|nr:hypothetical protein [Blastococcus litoris]
MRHFVAGACSLLLLTACGGTVSGSATTSSVGALGGAAAEGAGTARCTSPAGFSVAHPADWSVNPGEVLPGCSWFGSEPFTVPEASDVRIADVALVVESGAHGGRAWPDATARTTVEVAGRPGVRVEQVAAPGFYPEGTRITTYVVDLDPGRPDGAVLVADTVGLPGFDYERNVEVLDAMMSSLTLDAAERV